MTATKKGKKTKRPAVQQLDTKTRPFVTLHVGRRGRKSESRICFNQGSSFDIHLFRIRGLAYDHFNKKHTLNGVYEVTHVDSWDGTANLRSISSGRRTHAVRFVVGAVKFLRTCEEHRINGLDFVLLPGGAMVAGCSFFTKEGALAALKLVGKHLGYEFSD